MEPLHLGGGQKPRRDLDIVFFPQTVTVTHAPSNRLRKDVTPFMVLNPPTFFYRMVDCFRGTLAESVQSGEVRKLPNSIEEGTHLPA